MKENKSVDSPIPCNIFNMPLFEWDTVVPDTLISPCICNLVFVKSRGYVTEMQKNIIKTVVKTIGTAHL
jgi:hypothetical protein